MSSSHNQKPNPKIRPVHPRDFPQIDQILIDADLDKGETVFKLWFDNTKTIWQVAEDENGKIVAVSLLHRLPIRNEFIVFRAYNYINQEYQGLGLMGRFRQAYKDASTLGNATDEAILKMSSWFKKFGPKIVCYIGKPGLNRLNRLITEKSINFDILSATTDKDMKDLLNYDRTVFDLDRRQFMKEWCSQNRVGDRFARTLIARNRSNDQIVGFGTIRLFSKKFHIQPLYADNPEIARSILDELIEIYGLIHDNREIAFNFFANNRFMMDYVEMLDLKLTACQTRAYTKGADGQIRAAVVDAKLIRFDRVHGVQYYWPV